MTIFLNINHIATFTRVQKEQRRFSISWGDFIKYLFEKLTWGNRSKFSDQVERLAERYFFGFPSVCDAQKLHLIMYSSSHDWVGYAVKSPPLSLSDALKIFETFLKTLTEVDNLCWLR